MDLYFNLLVAAVLLACIYVLARLFRSFLGLFIKPSRTGRVTKYAIDRVGRRHHEHWSELFSWSGFYRYFRARIDGRVSQDLTAYCREGAWERAKPKYEEQTIWATADGRWRIAVSFSVRVCS